MRIPTRATTEVYRLVGNVRHVNFGKTGLTRPIIKTRYFQFVVVMIARQQKLIEGCPIESNHDPHATVACKLERDEGTPEAAVDLGISFG
jgi:hypothetical protein